MREGGSNAPSVCLGLVTLVAMGMMNDGRVEWGKRNGTEEGGIRGISLFVILLLPDGVGGTPAGGHPRAKLVVGAPSPFTILDYGRL